MKGEPKSRSTYLSISFTTRSWRGSTRSGEQPKSPTSSECSGRDRKKQARPSEPRKSGNPRWKLSKRLRRIRPSSIWSSSKALLLLRQEPCGRDCLSRPEISGNSQVKERYPNLISSDVQQSASETPFPCSPVVRTWNTCTSSLTYDDQSGKSFKRERMIIDLIFSAGSWHSRCLSWSSTCGWTESPYFSLCRQQWGEIWGGCNLDRSIRSKCVR